MIGIPDLFKRERKDGHSRKKPNKNLFGQIEKRIRATREEKLMFLALGLGVSVTVWLFLHVFFILDYSSALFFFNNGVRNLLIYIAAWSILPLHILFDLVSTENFRLKLLNMACIPSAPFVLAALYKQVRPGLFAVISFISLLILLSPLIIDLVCTGLCESMKYDSDDEDSQEQKRYFNDLRNYYKTGIYKSFLWLFALWVLLCFIMSVRGTVL